MQLTDLPDEIKLNGLTYALSLVKDLKDDDGDEANGICHSEDQWIKLDSDLRGHDKQRFILMHEITHIIEDHAGLDLKEKQIDSIARSLCSLFVNNPELMAWLMEPKPARKRKTLKGSDEDPAAGCGSGPDDRTRVAAV